MKRICILLALISLMPGLFAQAPRRFTLEECITYAQEQSPEARIAQKNLEIAGWRYRSFRAGLKPQVNLRLNSPGFLRSINSIVQPDGTQNFVQQNQAFSNAQLIINQDIAPTGGTVFLTSGLNRLDVFGPSGYVLWQSTPLVLGVQQPLFAYNSFRWEKEIQPKRYALAEIQYLEILESIAADITGKFFEVHQAHMAVGNARANVAINDSIFTISEGRFRVGRIAENDLLQTELAMLNSKTDLRASELALERSRTDLAISLGFEGPDDIRIIPPEDYLLVDIDMDKALKQARANRSDIVDWEIQTLEAESALQQARAANRFQADINASFGLNQSGSTLGETYDQPLDQETFSVGITVPLLNWGKGKAEREAAEAGRVRVEESIRLAQRRFELNVRFQVLEFQRLQEQLQISLKADTIARRRFEVAKNRYLIGKIDITNLQIAQNEKDAAQRALIGMLRQYWVSYYELRRATLYDWERRMPLKVRDDLDFDR